MTPAAIARQKPLTYETAEVVKELRAMKEAHERLHDRSPLSYALGAAISRLCLLDVTMHRFVVIRDRLSGDDRLALEECGFREVYNGFDDRVKP